MQAFLKSVELLVDLASLQTAFLTLDEAIKTTNRRVNALDNVVRPRLENTISYIKARPLRPLYVVVDAPLVPRKSDGVISVFACVLKLRKADAMVSIFIIRHASQLGNACIPDPSVIMRPDLSVFSAANGVLNCLSSGVAALCMWTLLVLLDLATLKHAPHAVLAQTCGKLTLLVGFSEMNCRHPSIECFTHVCLCCPQVDLGECHFCLWMLWNVLCHL